MKIHKYLLLMISISALVFGQENEREVAYIKNHAKYAIEEMHKFKIPASITLAQGVIETAFGQSELAVNANNHFGIKCKTTWTGMTYRYSDDAPNECFRKYPTVRDSYRDHSKFLAERPYYKNLFLLELADYKGWSYGLKKAGYATNPNYAPMLIRKIDKYGLNNFDKVKEGEIEREIIAWASKYDTTTPIVVEKEPFTTNEPVLMLKKTKPDSKVRLHTTGIKYVVLQKDETLVQLSIKHKIKVRKLLKYNDLVLLTDIREGQNVFLEKKKKNGATLFYTALQGEDMYIVSQKNGIRLKNLYKKNKLSPSYKLLANKVLRLQ